MHALLPVLVPADLADTGATTTWLLPVGGGIVLLGIVLLVLMRIRRSKTDR